MYGRAADDLEDDLMDSLVKRPVKSRYVAGLSEGPVMSPGHIKLESKDVHMQDVHPTCATPRE